MAGVTRRLHINERRPGGQEQAVCQKKGGSMSARSMAAGLVLGSMWAVGCTAVHTQMLGPTDNRGIVYYLPKGVTTVSVVEVKRPDKSVGQALRLGETTYLPDTNQAYCLNHKPSVWADDDLAVTLTPEGLLSRIAVSTQDRTADVVVQIAKAAAALAPGAVGEETVLYSAPLDLTDRQAVEAFNAVLAKQYTGLKLAVDAGALAAESPAPPRSLAGVACATTVTRRCVLSPGQPG
jgi:hypothetical protein